MFLDFYAVIVSIEKDERRRSMNGYSFGTKLYRLRKNAGFELSVGAYNAP